MTKATAYLLLCACLSLAAPAAAQDWIDEYSYDFSTNPQESFSGTDGWVSGYTDDRWTTAWFTDYREVNPTTDDSGGEWSGNGAINNHLCQEDEGPWRNASVEAQFVAMDDDALGLVIRKSAPATFYLFFMTNDYKPPAGQGGQGGNGDHGAFLYRVEDGFAEEVAASNTSYEEQGGDNWGYQRFRLQAVDGAITAFYADDESGPWTGGTEIFSWTDPAPLPAGHVGVYSYNSGETNGNVGFRDPLVQLADADGDGTPDDLEGTGDDDDDDDVSDDDDDDDDDVSDDDDISDDDDDDSAGAGDDDDFVLVQNANDCGCRQATSRHAGASALVTALALMSALLRRRR